MADQHGRDGREWLDSVAHGFTHDDDLLSDRLHDELMDADTVDLAMVHADDALLDRLAGLSTEDIDDRLDMALAEDELNALLLSWRADVDAEPIPELVDPDTALATVQAARVRKRYRPRLLVPVAAAAAVLAVAFTGVGLAARDAQPGDTLWGLTRVLYADHARSVEAAASVRTDLANAKTALKTGNVTEAASALSSAEQVLPAVSPEDGKDALAAQHASLLAQIPPPVGTGGTTITPTQAAPTATTEPGSTTQQSSPPATSTVPTSPSTSPGTTTPPTTTSPPTTETGSSPRDDTPPGSSGGSVTGQGTVGEGGTGAGVGPNADTGAGTGATPDAAVPGS